MGIYCGEVSAKRKRWAEPEKVDAEAPYGGAPPEALDEIVRIALRRGVTDLGEFFRPTFAGSMPDPYALKSMEEAVLRFCAAVENGETIAVLGDYDVDGAASTSLLLRYLRMLGHERTVFHIPDRLTEGYGPNVPAVERLHRDEGATLLMVVDSGTMAFEPMARAEELGFDRIILDHHDAKEEVPPGILVNPKRRDEDGSLSYLCAAGLCFLFLVGVQRELRNRGFFEKAQQAEPDLRDLLGIVALATVADVVPLVGLNRAYVRLGLPRMDRIPGLRALAVATAEDRFTPRTCGFVYGPCINAGGRIGDTRLGTRLLIADDEDEAAELAKVLAQLNSERRSVQRSILDEAIQDADEHRANDGIIVSYGEDWHPGVVGIVAARLKDRLDKPAIVIGREGKASCRAVDGFDIGRAVIEAKDAGILKAGGGHAAAAGLTIDPARIDELRAFMNRQIEGFEPPPTHVDLVVECGTLTPDLVESMALLEPFGRGNPEPRIAVVGGFCRKVMILKEEHVKAFLTGPKGEVELILFRGVGSPVGDAIQRAEGGMIDVYGTARLNTYGGTVRVEIQPEDVMLSSADEAARDAA